MSLTQCLCHERNIWIQSATVWSPGAVLQMSGEHDSFVPHGDKNPRINKEASKEAQPFPEDRG